MVSATANQKFTLPAVQLAGRPAEFSRERLDRLLRSGHQAVPADGSAIGAVLERIEELRGPKVAALANMKLGDLLSESVAQIDNSRTGLIAPLTILRQHLAVMRPKIVLRVTPAHEILEAELQAYHLTCRRAGIEFMCITNEQIADGYLQSRYFKINIKAAFYCDALTNKTVFCPTLRDWGFEQWDQDISSTPRPFMMAQS